MRKLSLITLAGALTLALSLSTTIVVADKVYHSERLPFDRTDAGAFAGHPDLRSGQVVNIHPNGPVNGALERYMINGAKPQTSYGVVILAFDDPACGGTPSLSIPTTTLVTNKQGNAHGQAKFSAEELVPFSGMTLGVRWTLVANNVVAYQTDCTIVTID